MIERIIIENYKSIRKMDLTLESINIFIGGNGAGKSNFISFFEVVKQSYQNDIGDYAQDRGGAAIFLHRGIKGAEYISGLLDFENTNAFKFELVPTINYRSLRLAAESSGDYFNDDPIGRTDKDYSKWHWKSLNNPWRDQREKYITAYLNSFNVYHFHDTGRTANIKQIHSLDDNRFLRADAGNLAAFLFNLKENHPKNYQRIEMLIRSIAPFFDRFDLKPLARSSSSDLIKIEWKEKGTDMYLDAFSLSDGTLRFIALATLLLQPDPPKTIIIDEPELGLHPNAINKIAGLIQKASRASQIIVSTQSAGLVNNFEPESIITVDRSEGQSVFERLDKDRLDNWLEDFSMGELWTKHIIGGQP